MIQISAPAATIGHKGTGRIATGHAGGAGFALALAAFAGEGKAAEVPAEPVGAPSSDERQDDADPGKIVPVAAGEPVADPAFAWLPGIVPAPPVAPAAERTGGTAPGASPLVGADAPVTGAEPGITPEQIASPVSRPTDRRDDPSIPLPVPAGESPSTRPIVECQQPDRLSAQTPTTLSSIKGAPRPAAPLVMATPGRSLPFAASPAIDPVPSTILQAAPGDAAPLPRFVVLAPAPGKAAGQPADDVPASAQGALQPSADQPARHPVSVAQVVAPAPDEPRTPVRAGSPSATSPEHSSKAPASPAEQRPAQPTELAAVVGRQPRREAGVPAAPTAQPVLPTAVPVQPPVDRVAPGPGVLADLAAPAPDDPRAPLRAGSPSATLPEPSGEAPAAPVEQRPAQPSEPAALVTRESRHEPGEPARQIAQPALATAVPVQPPVDRMAQGPATLADFTAPAPHAPRRDPDDAAPAPIQLAASAPAPVASTADAQQSALDLRQERWPHAMIDRIERLRDAADATDTRIRLVPDALGQVDVAVRRDGDTVHVHFTAEQAATRTLLADAQPRLAEIAEARGLRLGQTGVDGGTGGQPDQRHDAPRPAPRAPSAAHAQQILSPTDDRIA